MAVSRNVGGPKSDKQQTKKSREAGASQANFIIEVKAPLRQAFGFSIFGDSVRSPSN